jgi:hypothetical protein
MGMPVVLALKVDVAVGVVLRKFNVEKSSDVSRNQNRLAITSYCHLQDN